MNKMGINNHSAAWEALTWIAFILSFMMTIVGLFFAPVDVWIKGFLGMGIVFLSVSCFSLAKTLRDRHEGRRLINRMDEARAEKFLADIE